MIGYCPASERICAVGGIGRFRSSIVSFHGENRIQIKVKVRSNGSVFIESHRAWFTLLLAIDAVAGETPRLGFEIAQLPKKNQS